MYFTDPSKCTRCQNRGHFEESLINGKCHRCEVRGILSSCITANVRRGMISLAVRQLRWLGF